MHRLALDIADISSGDRSPFRWPAGCVTNVDPAKRNPRFPRSLLILSDSGLIAGTWLSKTQALCLVVPTKSARRCMTSIGLPYRGQNRQTLLDKIRVFMISNREFIPLPSYSVS